MQLSSFAKKLNEEKSLAIFCHMRPDGDTIGSAMALKLGLNALGIKAEAFCCDEIPHKYSFLLKKHKIHQKIFGDFSAYFAIDNADITRLGLFSENFTLFKNTYSLDHHISNTNFAKYNCVIDSASNCENVLSLLKELNVEINSEIANFLMLGLVTDTGNFRHKNVMPETLEKASFLLRAGADLNNIVYKSFTEQSKARAMLFGKVMSKLRYFMNDKISIGTIMQSDLSASGATQDETEGFIDFILGINTVEVAVCVMQISDFKFKVSLRSKKTDVNKIAGVFGGGGHILAAGCQIQGEYEEVIDKLSYAIGQYIEE